MASRSGPSRSYDGWTDDVVREALADALCAIDEYEGTLPCVLICTDRVTGEQSFSGPIPSRAVGELIRRNEMVSAGADSMLEFALEPLYPALDVDAVRCGLPGHRASQGE